MNFSSLLSNAKKDIPVLDVERLACEVFNITRTQLITQTDFLPKEKQKKEFLKKIDQLRNTMSLSQVLGKQWFYQLEFDVTNEVLTPRPETEWLVEWQIKEYGKLFGHQSSRSVQEILIQKPSRIIDIGTGSGCIAISLAFAQPSAQILAIDICKKALSVAKKNAVKHGVDNRIEFRQSNLLTNIQNYEIEDSLIVTNLPYIPENDKTWMDKQVLEGDPGLALFSGVNGTDLYHKLFLSLPNTFRALSFEFDPPQKKVFQSLLSKMFPKRSILFYPDLRGKVRFGVVQ